MNKFHHIGIFVKNLDFGKKEISRFNKVASSSSEIIDEEMGVKIIFLKDYDGIRYELVAPFGDKSPVTNVLKRKKDFLNHIAYETDDFEIEINRLRKEGLVPLGAPKKAKAFQGSRVIFFLSPLGLIIELIELKK